MLQQVKEFEKYLISEEKSKATITKYTHDVISFIQWLDGRQINKAAVQEYKQWLENEYAAKSVNSILSSLNSFFEWSNLSECRVKSLKIQKNTFKSTKITICHIYMQELVDEKSFFLYTYYL